MCESLTYLGTCYLLGQYVVLGKYELDRIVGEIIFYAAKNNFLLLISMELRKMIACFQFRLGVYITKHAEKQFISMSVDDLNDYYPLHAYNCLHQTECVKGIKALCLSLLWDFALRFF